METPPGLEGKILEDVMAEWRRRNPDADTASYNRAWSNSLETIRAKLAADRNIPPAQPSTPRIGVNASGLVMVAPSLLERLAFTPPPPKPAWPTPEQLMPRPAIVLTGKARQEGSSSRIAGLYGDWDAPPNAVFPDLEPKERSDES